LKEQIQELKELLKKNQVKIKQLQYENMLIQPKYMSKSEPMIENMWEIKKKYNPNNSNFFIVDINTLRTRGSTPEYFFNVKGVFHRLFCHFEVIDFPYYNKNFVNYFEENIHRDVFFKLFTVTNKYGYKTYEFTFNYDLVVEQSILDKTLQNLNKFNIRNILQEDSFKNYKECQNIYQSSSEDVKKMMDDVLKISSILFDLSNEFLFEGSEQLLVLLINIYKYLYLLKNKKY